MTNKALVAVVTVTSHQYFIRPPKEIDFSCFIAVIVRTKKNCYSVKIKLYFIAYYTDVSNVRERRHWLEYYNSGKLQKGAFNNMLIELTENKDEFPNILKYKNIF